MIHVVRPGETLFGIGQRYNIPHQELARVNRLRNPDLIRIGQRIFIPGAHREVAVGVASADKAGPEIAARAKGPARIEAQAPSQVEMAAELPPVGQIKESDVTQVTPVGAIPLPEMEEGAFLWPVLGTVHSGFGPRGAGFHDGIDIAAPEGTPIRVVADGEVLYSERLRGYGNIIIVRHDGGYVSVYAHNQVNLVEEGQSVSRGEVIGLVGSTGRATGPHLHFELRKNNRARDPMPYLSQFCCAEAHSGDDVRSSTFKVRSFR